MISEIVDGRGLSAPLPIMKTGAALAAGTGEILVLLDDESAVEDVVRFARARGRKVETGETAGEYRLIISQ